MKQKAVECGSMRLWLITTNDNVDALRFYQMRGFVLVKIHIRWEIDLIAVSDATFFTVR